MGTGKGKTRRAQAGLSPEALAERALALAKEATYDRGIWSEFVKSSDMMTAKVYPYYLGKSASSPPDYTFADHEKVVTELLADFVAVGALTLPSPYTADDFGIKMTDGNHSWNQYCTVIVKRYPSLKTQWTTFRYHLGHTASLDNEMVRYTLGQIFKGVESLLIEVTP